MEKMTIKIPNSLKKNIYKHKYQMQYETSFRFSIKRESVKDNIPCCDEYEIINYVDFSPATFSQVHYDLNVISLTIDKQNLHLICFPTRNGMQCPRTLNKFNIPITDKKYTFESKNTNWYFNYHFNGENYCVIAINYDLNTKQLVAKAHIADDNGKMFDSVNIILPKQIQSKILAYCDDFQNKKFRTNLLNTEPTTTLSL